MTAPVFDASGSDGKRGTSGSSRDNSNAREGRHGRAGGDGSRGQDGIPAGTITQQIISPESTPRNPPINSVLGLPAIAYVPIETSQTVHGGKTSRENTILKVGANEVISLKAKGGNGGSGGNGGNGEHGGTGVRYFHSTRLSPFSNTSFG
jgi:hypothetical protein